MSKEVLRGCDRKHVNRQDGRHWPRGEEQVPCESLAAGPWESPGTSWREAQVTGDTAGLGTAAVHHSELKVLIFSQAQVTCGLSARGSARPQQLTLLPLPCPPTPNPHFLPLPEQPLAARLCLFSLRVAMNHLPPLKEGIVCHLGRPQPVGRRMGARYRGLSRLEPCHASRSER